MMTLNGQLPKADASDKPSVFEIGRRLMIGIETPFQARNCGEPCDEMSVPRDILDQLLSGYLDDALSNDEQVQIERLLRDAPAVARELDGLRELRGSLKELSQADASVTLDDGFADRVLGAAVAQARAEGLDDEHPLVRLAEQPSMADRSKPVGWGRIASGLVALAASIAVAVVVLRTADDAPRNIELAQGQTGAVITTGNDSPPPIDTVAGNVADDASPTPSLGLNEPNLDAPSVVEPNLPELKPMIAADSTPDAADPDGVPATDNVAPIGSADTAVADVNQMLKDLDSRLTNGEAVSEAELLAAMNGLQISQSLLLVVEVERTELGREQRIVRKALRDSGIDPVEEKMIGDDLVSVLSQSLKDSGQTEGVQVLFLEASITKIDNLIARLPTYIDGVASSGMSMQVAAPVRDFVSRLKPVKPTSISRATSWQFQGQAAQALAGHLVNSDFKKMKPRPLQPQRLDDGPTQLGRVLILIR